MEDKEIVEYLKENKEKGKILEDVIWCDKYISFRHKMGCNCGHYKFKYEQN